METTNRTFSRFQDAAPTNTSISRRSLREREMHLRVATFNNRLILLFQTCDPSQQLSIKYINIKYFP